jgi:NAD+ synthase (glutamine-hydrolysing)
MNIGCDRIALFQPVFRRVEAEEDRQVQKSRDGNSGFGIYRVAVSVNRTYLALPERNGEVISDIVKKARGDGVAFLLFPELALSGYSCGDLFFQKSLLDSQNEALQMVLESTRGSDIVVVIGIFVSHRDRLYNCALVIQDAEPVGIVPKIYIPTKREYYEKRYFTSGIDIEGIYVDLLGREVPFGTDLLFCAGEIVAGVEICEDLWSLKPPSFDICSAGANLILNPSASNELVGKADYRRELVATQSARAICSYAYSSSGFGESTTDTIFGGDAMIAEYGSILARTRRFSMESETVYADVDFQRLSALRLSETAFCDAVPSKRYREIELHTPKSPEKIDRKVDPHPFVPSDETSRRERCEEIGSIQAFSLVRRMEHSRQRKAVIGISGGLDSTLALLTVVRAFDIMRRDRRDIVTVTMPGFGTTGRTYANAVKLCRRLGTDLREVDISNLCRMEFEAIGHDGESHDVVFENVQARSRTEILMNIANMESGLVIGTGDLSEIALGWSTYNGDHMSMYAINAGVPKSLVRYLVAHYAQEGELGEILEDILDTPVSPELLPAKDGEISQKTEDIVGPYELHDFFLYHFMKYGFEPPKIAFLAGLAFGEKYSREEIERWLSVFLKRFFSQQFKRSCMPDGPKVGTIALSPRADWRMPSDAFPKEWLDRLRWEDV